MRIDIPDTPRHIATIPRYSHVIVRVISGAMRIARDRQDLDSGGGLPITVTDNIVNLDWEMGQLWAVRDAAVNAVVEVLIP